MAQLRAGAMYATRPSFHCNSAISESGECPIPHPSRTTSDCTPLGGGTGGSNHLCSSGESTSRGILPSHGEKPAFRAGVGPAGASARQQLGATRDVARPDRFSGDQASERSLRPAASFDIGRLFGVSHRLATLKRRRLRRGHRWQLVHDRPEPGVDFGLKAAMPSRRDEIVDRVVAGIAQGPH